MMAWTRRHLALLVMLNKRSPRRVETSRSHWSDASAEDFIN
jgi:hypothetical protein